MKKAKNVADDIERYKKEREQRFGERYNDQPQRTLAPPLPGAKRRHSSISSLDSLEEEETDTEMILEDKEDII